MGATILLIMTRDLIGHTLAVTGIGVPPMVTGNTTLSANMSAPKDITCAGIKGKNAGNMAIARNCGNINGRSGVSSSMSSGTKGMAISMPVTVPVTNPQKMAPGPATVTAMATTISL